MGESGTTVLSNDGGATFTSGSADIGGEYGRVRIGPDGLLLAAGAHGDMAISTNGGLSWQVVATQTSQELVDVAFATPALGYALDARGGLQRTGNGGASWQTLSPGTTTPAKAVVALGNSALLVGPVGVYRAVAGGPFEPVTGGAVSSAHLSDYDVVGTTVFAFGQGTHTLIRSTDEGARWTALAVPLQRRASGPPGTPHRGQSRRLDPQRRVHERSARVPARHGRAPVGHAERRAHAGAKSSRPAPAKGSSSRSDPPAKAFSASTDFGTDHGDAYVLRTVNGGATWHPQELSLGAIPYGGLVASGGLDAAALVDANTVSGETEDRALFATTTGGDVSGPPETLALATSKPRLTGARCGAPTTRCASPERSPGRSAARRSSCPAGTWPAAPGSSSRSSPAPTAAASRPPGTSPSRPCSSRSGPARAAVPAWARRVLRVTVTK